MRIRNGEWKAVSGSPRLRALDVAIICASALFWSWFTLAIIHTTFYYRLAGQVDPSFFTAISIGAGTMVFAFCAVQPKRATKLLDSRKCEAITVAIAVLGGGLALGGSLASIVPLAIAGAIIMGAAFPYFMLEWCRMYSRSGARTTAPLTSGALALSISVDVAALALEPLMRCVLVASMPILIVAVLALVQALSTHSSQNRPTPVTLASGTAVGASDLLIIEPTTAKPPKRASRRVAVLETPVALPVSGLIYGFVFGALIGFDTLAIQAEYLTSLLCFVAMIACFVFSCVMPLNMRPVVDILQIVGIAGALALTQLAGTDGALHSWTIAAMLVGFMSFLVAFWTLSSYFATGQKQQVIPVFSMNLAMLCAGFLIGVFFQGVILGESLDGIQRTALAFLVVLAATLLSASGSLPINVFKASSAAEGVESVSYNAYHEGIAQEIAASHNLTGRETEILGLLISGRSRPRIAEILCVSENTVNSHIQHIYRKLGIHSFQELLDFVYHAGSQ